MTSWMSTGLALTLGCTVVAPIAAQQVEHLNPSGLHRNPAFTQAVVVTGPVKTVYVGGQNAVDSTGQLVGPGDIAVQAEQVLANLQAALAAAGAELHHVVKWNVLVVQGQPAQAGFEVFQRVWGREQAPPAITMAFVPALAHPAFLLEIDAVAVVPQSR